MPVDGTRGRGMDGDASTVPERVINKSLKSGVEIAKDRAVANASRQIDVAQRPYYRWRAE